MTIFAIYPTLLMGGGDVNINDDFVWILPDGWLTKFTGDDDIIVNATDASGVIVNYSVSATENGDPIPVSCVPLSGSFFAVGNSTVVCTAQTGIVSSFSVMVNFFDEDSDGVGDEFDNCPAIPNQDQADSDDDGIGDVCEPDTDSDGIIDDDDNCPAVPNPDQADANSNGVGDVCEDPETDTDGDGVPDITDNCPSVSNANQTDLDNDGIGDACDPVSFPFCISLPNNGNWIIVSSCTLENSFFAPSDVMVQNNSVLVIPDDSTLSINQNGFLLVKFGSGVLIETGGNVKIEPEPPASASVSIPQGTGVLGCEETNECFIPFEVIVGVGGTVTWSNDDAAAHTVTAGSVAQGVSGEFDSSLFFAGTTFSHTFESAGVFPYLCLVHPWMNGIVTVTGSTPPSPFITVQTDSNLYFDGDTIVVSGQVSPIIPETLIILQVWFDGNLIDLAQFFPSPNGSYSHTLLAESPKYNREGEYLIRVSHGEENTAETTFTFNPNSPPSTTNVSVPQGTSVPGCEETNECFIPFEVTIGVGGKVTWSIDDTAAHTVTAGSPADGPSGNFDSGLFLAGTTFSHTFRDTGTFDYFCMLHPWMTGIVTVQ